MARIREEGEHFRARLKSDEARNAFMGLHGAEEGLTPRGTCRFRDGPATPAVGKNFVLEREAPSWTANGALLWRAPPLREPGAQRASRHSPWTGAYRVCRVGSRDILAPVVLFLLKPQEPPGSCGLKWALRKRPWAGRWGRWAPILQETTHWVPFAVISFIDGLNTWKPRPSLAMHKVDNLT